MHVLIPFASFIKTDADAATENLRVPNLQRLLNRLTPSEQDLQDLHSLNAPHESAIARLWGWDRPDGALPFAALLANEDGVLGALPEGKPVGLLTPCHWQVGRDQVTLADPEGTPLSEAQSRSLYEAIRPLFVSDGFELVWGANTRWYGGHDSLSNMPCGSIDRAIGRHVDAWRPQGPNAAPIQRLLSEVQMLLHGHPINEERQLRGEPEINALWLSNCGKPLEPGDPIRVENALRAAALAGDVKRWLSAWQSLDATLIAELVTLFEQRNSVHLTLCGERGSVTFGPARRSLLQRGWWARLEPNSVLAAI